MGNKESIQYSVPVEGTENIPGQSAVYRSPTATDIELSGIKEENPKDLKTLFTIKLEEHADRLCLGHRPKIVKEVINEETKEIKTEVSFGEYEWITYRELDKNSNLLAQYITSLDIPKDESGNRLLGIFSKNCIEWTTTDVACILSNTVSVPFYNALSHDEIIYIIDQTQLSIIACDKLKALMLIEMKKNKLLDSLKHIICFEELSEEAIKSCEDSEIRYHFVEDAIQKSETLSFILDSPHIDSILTINYTSGTTGNPKGVKIVLIKLKI